MSKARMLSISLVFTICFVIIGVLIVLFIGETSPLKNVTANEQQEVLIEEADEISKIEKKPQGIRIMTDQFGLHDILFEQAGETIGTVSGPVKFIVLERRLELLTAESEAVINAMEGRTTSTVAVLNIQIENTSDEVVRFKLDEAKVVADTGEKAIINPMLSTTLGETLAPKSQKTGTLMIDFASDARNIATITLYVFPALSVNYDELSDAVELKIPMY